MSDILEGFMGSSDKKVFFGEVAYVAVGIYVQPCLTLFSGA